MLRTIYASLGIAETPRSRDIQCIYEYNKRSGVGKKKLQEILEVAVDNIQQWSIVDTYSYVPIETTPAIGTCVVRTS